MKNLLSIFRRKSAPPEALTFNQRVDAFWEWFQRAAHRFASTIDAGQCGSLAEEVSEKIDELFPGFAWVFGPGPNRRGHSFTLSGEGIAHRQVLALQWAARAPTIGGWTFHAARQPGPIKGHSIEIDGVRFDPKEIWVTPMVDTERERIDITVWHPAWDRIDPSQQSTVTFLFMDEALGEYGTDSSIGKVEFGNGKLAGAFPLEELSDYVEKTASDHGWKTHVPGSVWTLYETKQSSGDFPRADILTQNTCLPRLFTEFMEAAGEYADPLAGSGADYVFVSIDRSFFPEGEEVRVRGEIEDSVESALASIDGGRCIGGAFGRERCYSDFLIFDGDRSLNAVAEVLRGKRVPAGTTIEFFAREKRGQRIAL